MGSLESTTTPKYDHEPEGKYFNDVESISNWLLRIVGISTLVKSYALSSLTK